MTTTIDATQQLSTSLWWISLSTLYARRDVCEARGRRQIFYHIRCMRDRTATVRLHMT